MLKLFMHKDDKKENALNIAKRVRRISENRTERDK